MLQLSKYFNISFATFSQVRYYAARKGTRARAASKKVKKEVVKLTHSEKVLRSKRVSIVKPDALVYDLYPGQKIEDDVVYAKVTNWKIYPFAEAIQCHREYLHPTMHDDPDAMVNIFVELQAKNTKKTKLPKYNPTLVSMKHTFDHGEQRNILVFCKAEEQIKEAIDGGAILAGGSDIIKSILKGEISIHNYDTIIAHPVMLPELLTIRGLLKHKQPSIKNNTLGPDLKELLHCHLYGIKYLVTTYNNFPEYRRTSIPIGPLSMNVEHLEDNLKEALDSVFSHKSKEVGDYITRVRVECLPSTERLKINHDLYIQENPTTNESPEDSEQEEEL